MAENLRFIEAYAQNPRIRGVLGLHANFTLKDGTLEKAARSRPSGAGCHIHLAEDPMDVTFTREALGSGLVERLDRMGLLDERSLLAHGIHLTDDEYRQIAASGATLLHNPESNANNGVGRLDPVTAHGNGCQVGLGTDGMSGNMMRSLRVAFLMLRHGRRDPSRGFEVMPGLLANNARVAGRFLDEPRLGFLEPAAPADFAVIDCVPPTPLSSGNTFGHLIYGLSESPVRHTIARGRVVLEDFKIMSMDSRGIADHARHVAPYLWQRFHALGWGTPYLG